MFKFLSIFVLITAFLGAEPLKSGSSADILQGFEYMDQHDQKATIAKETRLVIAAFEKGTGAIVNKYLDSKPPLYLQEHNTVFIADINKMPKILTELFALPKMRKYKHRIYLHYGEVFQDVVPNQDEKITLIYIEDAKIKDISFVSTQEELETAIEK